MTIRKRLQFSGGIFFGRFYSLTEVQQKTIPCVLDGFSCTVIAPTASGKTEAIMAPVVERIYREKWKPLSALYIAPTRALVNDMYGRISDQLENTYVSVAMKTGDKNYFKANRPQDILITTPESFDSLLCRHPSALKNVRAIIIDEVHLLDNTYRGDQVISLIERIKKLIDNNLNVYLISATVSNPKELSQRYIAGEFKVIEVKDTSEMHYTLIPNIEKIEEYLIKENLKKLLIFCNSRTNVEMLSQKLSGIFGKRNVVAHHGSLSKTEREEAEQFMKESRFGICVSTMTLEIGIDIGSLDAVVLADPPWTLSSAIQRIGRSNRRSKRRRVFAIYGNEDSKLYLKEMLEAIKNGTQAGTNQYSPDLTVIVQQIFSVLYGKRKGVTEQYLHDIFSKIYKTSEVNKVLNYLSKKGWIEERRGVWLASEKLLDLGEKGKIHSNIPDSRSIQVKEINSKHTVGQIILPVSDIFILSGKPWKTVKIVKDTLWVKHAKLKGSPPAFKQVKKRGAFYYFLPDEMQHEMDKRYGFKSI